MTEKTISRVEVVVGHLEIIEKDGTHEYQLVLPNGRVRSLSHRRYMELLAGRRDGRS